MINKYAIEFMLEFVVVFFGVEFISDHFCDSISKSTVKTNFNFFYSSNVTWTILFTNINGNNIFYVIAYAFILWKIFFFCSCYYHSLSAILNVSVQLLFRMQYIVMHRTMKLNGKFLRHIVGIGDITTRSFMQQYCNVFALFVSIRKRHANICELFIERLSIRNA